MGFWRGKAIEQVFVRCDIEASLEASHDKADLLQGFYLADPLGVVRLQSDAFESELKVRQKERVPSRFDTRLWLYKLHGRVQCEAFRFN